MSSTCTGAFPHPDVRHVSASFVGEAPPACGTLPECFVCLETPWTRELWVHSGHLLEMLGSPCFQGWPLSCLSQAFVSALSWAELGCCGSTPRRRVLTGVHTGHLGSTSLILASEVPIALLFVKPRLYYETCSLKNNSVKNSKVCFKKS